MAIQSTQAAYRKPRASGPFLVGGDGLFANSETADYALGQKVFDVDGNVYRYVLATEALARGQAVTATALAAWDSGILVDGAVTAGDTKIHIDTVTTAVAAGYWSGYWIGQAPGATGLGALHKIAGHEALAASGEGDIFLDVSTPAAEAISNDVALLIYHPWKVELTDATTEAVRGIVVNTIDAGNYGFIQTGGFVPAVLVGHSTSAAVVVNEPMAPLATPAGSLQGVAAAGPTESQILTIVMSRIIAQEAVGADTVCYVPAYIHGEL